MAWRNENERNIYVMQCTLRPGIFQLQIVALMQTLQNL